MKLKKIPQVFKKTPLKKFHVTLYAKYSHSGRCYFESN